MEYLLKSALIIGGFYLVFKTLLQRHTFFGLNRWFFMFGIMLAIFLPLISISIETEVVMPEKSMLNYVNNSFDNSNISTNNIGTNLPVFEQENSINWLLILGSIYGIGVLLLIMKFAIELLSLILLISRNKKERYGKYIYVEDANIKSPFSFFHWIVFDRNLYSKSELSHILKHEKIHADQWHSLDVLIMQLFVAFQWFNPFVWLYKREMQQQLEFIADDKTIINNANSADYQLLLLRIATGERRFSLANNFFKSPIKKRIMKLHQTKSNGVSIIKYTLIIPIIAVFIYSFSIQEKIVYIELESGISSHNEETKSEITPRFSMPILEKNITRIASGYGMRIHPIFKTKKLHNGIDFTAKIGIEVLSSANGVISEIGDDETDGKFIVVTHNEHYVTKYKHLSEIVVKKGDTVVQGQIIGKVGNTGMSTGPHLHFEIRENGKAINPMIFFRRMDKKTEKKITNRKKKIIVIDAGHGGMDNGAVADGVMEKDIVLKIAKMIFERNQSKDFEIVLIRKFDIFLPLTERAMRINDIIPDLLISIHIDDSKDSLQRGMEVYFNEYSAYTPEIKEFTNKFLSAANENNFEIQGIKTANLYLLQNTNCPSFTLELGNFSNTTDRELLQTQEGQIRISNMISEYLDEMF